MNFDLLSTNEQNMLDTINAAAENGIVGHVIADTAAYEAGQIVSLREVFTTTGAAKQELREAMDRFGRIHHAVKLLRDA